MAPFEALVVSIFGDVSDRRALCVSEPTERH